jgi:[ribosomal protein S18]-alanine N-acetyltransferase
MTERFSPRVVIRKTVAQDIKTILEIEKEQFANPWKQKDFTPELNHDIAYFYVAEDGDTGVIAGYIIFWVIEDMIELHNIAVAARYKKKGIGKKLMLFLLETARQQAVKDVFLEVRQSNIEAIRFYEAFHFQFVSIRKNYYSEPTEDAVIYKFIVS